MHIISKQKWTKKKSSKRLNHHEHGGKVCRAGEKTAMQILTVRVVPFATISICFTKLPLVCTLINHEDAENLLESLKESFLQFDVSN